MKPKIPCLKIVVDTEWQVHKDKSAIEQMVVLAAVRTMIEYFIHENGCIISMEQEENDAERD